MLCCDVIGGKNLAPNDGEDEAEADDGEDEDEEDDGEDAEEEEGE